MKFFTLLLTASLITLPSLSFADGGTHSLRAAQPNGADTPDTADRVQPEPADSCDYSDLIGQTPDAVDKSRFPADATVRVLKPDQMVTMEYMFGRINLRVDDAGVIESVTCG